MLAMSDLMVFWIPEDSTGTAFVETMIELGEWYRSGKVLFGCPEQATHLEELRQLVDSRIDTRTFSTLEDTLRNALHRLGDGAPRSGGDRDVSLDLWRVPHFQKWRGDRPLDSLRVLSMRRVNPDRDYPYSCLLRAVRKDIGPDWVQRNHEFLCVPDMVHAIAVHHREPVEESTVLLVRSHESSARTTDGRLRTSLAMRRGISPEGERASAVWDLRNRAGILVDETRLHQAGSRQTDGVLTTAHGHLFIYELNDADLQKIRHRIEERRQLQGEAPLFAHEEPDSAIDCEESADEFYPVELHRYGDLLAPTQDIVDWATLGMITVAMRHTRPLPAS